MNKNIQNNYYIFYNNQKQFKFTILTDFLLSLIKIEEIYQLIKVLKLMRTFLIHIS